RRSAGVVLGLQIGLVLPLRLRQLHEQAPQLRVGNALRHEPEVRLRVALALQRQLQRAGQVEVRRLRRDLHRRRLRVGGSLADRLAVFALHARAVYELSVGELQQALAHLRRRGALRQGLVIEARLHLGLDGLAEDFLHRRLERLHGRGAILLAAAEEVGIRRGVVLERRAAQRLAEARAAGRAVLLYVHVTSDTDHWN